MSCVDNLINRFERKLADFYKKEITFNEIAPECFYLNSMHIILKRNKASKDEVKKYLDYLQEKDLEISNHAENERLALKRLAQLQRKRSIP